MWHILLPLWTLVYSKQRDLHVEGNHAMQLFPLRFLIIWVKRVFKQTASGLLGSQLAISSNLSFSVFSVLFLTQSFSPSHPLLLCLFFFLSCPPLHDKYSELQTEAHQNVVCVKNVSQWQHHSLCELFKRLWIWWKTIMALLGFERLFSCEFSSPKGLCLQRLTEKKGLERQLSVPPTLLFFITHTHTHTVCLPHSVSHQNRLLKSLLLSL